MSVGVGIPALTHSHTVLRRNRPATCGTGGVIQSKLPVSNPVVTPFGTPFFPQDSRPRLRHASDTDVPYGHHSSWDWIWKDFRRQERSLRRAASSCACVHRGRFGCVGPAWRYAVAWVWMWVG